MLCLHGALTGCAVRVHCRGRFIAGCGSGDCPVPDIWWEGRSPRPTLPGLGRPLGSGFEALLVLPQWDEGPAGKRKCKPQGAGTEEGHCPSIPRPRGPSSGAACCKAPRARVRSTKSEVVLQLPLTLGGGQALTLLEVVAGSVLPG